MRYPEELLAREPAPPFTGEGEFALWHFSEDATLHRLDPHRPATNPDAPAAVWAVDTRHAPMFWFPRDCPRACFWAVSTTTPEDRERWTTGRVHVIESSWLERVRNARLYAYRLPIEDFRPHDVGGFWVSERTVDALERTEVGDVLARHADAEIELRITPALMPLWQQVIASTVEFSGHRLRNLS